MQYLERKASIGGPLDRLFETSVAHARISGTFTKRGIALR